MHVHGISQGRPEREQGPHPVHEKQDHVHPETGKSNGRGAESSSGCDQKEIRRGKTTTTDQERVQLQLQIW